MLEGCWLSLLLFKWGLYYACMNAKSFQSCLTLCDAVNCSPPGSSVHGIFLGKNTGVGCPALLQGIFQTQGLNSDLLCLLNLSLMFLAFADGLFTTSITWEAWSSPLLLLSHFSRVRLFAPLWTVARQTALSMGILQARTLEWVALPFSRGSAWPRDWTQVSCISRQVL